MITNDKAFRNSTAGAFPLVILAEATKREWGLTKRELFALAIEAGLCANSGVTPTDPEMESLAVRKADMLLEKLAK